MSNQAPHHDNKQRLTKLERYSVEQAVIDCVTFRLTPKEATEYIIQKTGVEISLPYYYMIKGRVESNGELAGWLDYHARVGFLAEHKRHIDQLTHLTAQVYQLFEKEVSSDKPNKYLALKMCEQIRENIKLVSALNVGSPILGRIKALVDNRQHAKKDEVIEQDISQM